MYSLTGQCPVSVPTIISSTSSEDACRVVSQKSLSYTCNNDNLVLVWDGSIFSGGSVSVTAGIATATPTLTGGSEVTVMITNEGNTSCLRSDLTFNGSLPMLRSLLNGVTLSCTDPDGPPNSTTIVIPSKNNTVCDTHTHTLTHKHTHTHTHTHTHAHTAQAHTHTHTYTHTNTHTQ